MVSPTTAAMLQPTNLDPRASEFVPSTGVSDPPSRDYASDQEKAILKSRILSSLDRSSHGSESGSVSSDVDDPNTEYVRLNLQIMSLKRQFGTPENTGTIHKLEERLQVVKMDYLFDERDAEAQLQIERMWAEKAALQAKLRGASDSPDITPNSELKPKRLAILRPQPNPERQATPDIFDDGDSESASGLFDILQEMPTTETNEKGTLIYVRDMSLPKHWSGRTPKTLLSETVAKVDRYAVTSYQIISGSSRAKRALVLIRWEGQKYDQWSMEDVACHDDTQAEQFIATVALFSLTFPDTLGFAGSSLSATGSQTFFRLLPAVYRDLWDELATKRKRDDDATNRAVWSKLKSLVQFKFDLNNKVSRGIALSPVFHFEHSRGSQSTGKPSKHPSYNKNDLVHRPNLSNDLSSEQIIAGFNARRASSGYQEMLVRLSILPQPSRIDSENVSASTQLSSNCKA